MSKVILVTGGSSGIGRSICTRLAAEGHRVYGTSRKEQVGEVQFHSLRMDITDEGSVNAAVAELFAREGRIDVVVNNAGMGIIGPAEDTTPALAQQVFDTNVFGAHRVCRAVLPHMRAQRSGLVINISSVAANFGLPYRAFYSASKSALDRISESLAIEVAPFGIHVVTLQPGEYRTNIAAGRLEAKPLGAAYVERYTRAMDVLAGSLGDSRDPDEVARLVSTIMASRAPRSVYHAAQGKQKLSVFLKKILPGRIFQGMVGKHYE